MDNSVLNNAKNAYMKKDFAQVLELLEPALSEEIADGEALHLLGNAAMKMRQYPFAVKAYTKALLDNTYNKRGSLWSNMGKAYIASNDINAAIEAFTQSSQEPDNNARYKAFSDLGSAYVRLNNFRDAGTAFREAALDQNNPNPTNALVSLGSCFIELDRPNDAVESLRSALDFAEEGPERSNVYSEIGRAYVNLNRMDEALSSFESALAFRGYELSPEAQIAYSTAREVIAARNRSRSGAAIGETDTFLNMLDPLDPTGESGNLMPSPDESGFFSITEEEMKLLEKEDVAVKRKGKGGCLKALLVIVLLLSLVLGFLAYAFYKGYGYPTQENSIEGLFEAHASDGDITTYWVKDTEVALIEDQMREVAPTTDIEIIGLDRSMSESEALVNAHLSEGGTITYTVKLVREGIGWKISAIATDYSSQTADESDQQEAAPLPDAETDAPEAPDGTVDPLADPQSLELEQLPDEAPAELSPAENGEQNPEAAPQVE